MLFEGYMAQHAAETGETEDVYQKLMRRMEVANRESATPLPTMEGPLVNINHPGGTIKRKNIPIKKGASKDKCLLQAFAKSGSNTRSSKSKDLGGLDGINVMMCKGLKLDLGERELSLVDGTDSSTAIRAMLEFQSRAYVMGRRVANLLQRELADEEKNKAIEDLNNLKAKFETEHSVWITEKKSLDENIKRLKSWKTRCLDSEKKSKQEIADLSRASEEVKEKLKAVEKGKKAVEAEVTTLMGHVITEHVKGFKKGVRQADFLYEGVSASDARFDINQDIYNGRMMHVDVIAAFKRSIALSQAETTGDGDGDGSSDEGTMAVEDEDMAPVDEE